MKNLNPAPGRIRLIGGQWKRTPIPVPDAPGLRPTPDRVRQTVFNWITHLRPDFSTLRGLDLYAGTGAMGFELASRGAARVVLVERAAPLVAQLRALQKKLGAAQIEIMAGDALAVAQRLPTAAFDVVFLDPPYGAQALPTALAAVQRLLAPDALVYAEDAAPLTPERAAALGFTVVRAGKAGAVCFHLLALSSLQRRSLPCRARVGLYADTARQASRMRLETPVSPPTPLPEGEGL